ncbi:DEAD box helicase [Ectocarpus siliculosus]|uniref:DEAD box helicase n=1 Tax=Ectocarpus siliculosus TaxID=2880 RepID=D7FJM8_ECTSI|nr:DEAD box helicase [Ectocarpus siliculosus]|eukprot:CBJ29130.1 DEAD box helicase [Ectocarpus siliculosus]
MKKPSSGLVMTIASDDEVEPEADTDDDNESEAPVAVAKPAAAPLTKAGRKRQRQKAAAAAGAGRKEGEGAVDPSFSFDVDSGNLGIAERQAVKGWDFKSAIEKLAMEDPRRARTGRVLEDRIAAKRSELRKGKKKAKDNAKAIKAAAAAESQEQDVAGGEGEATASSGLDKMDEDEEEDEAASANGEGGAGSKDGEGVEEESDDDGSGDDEEQEEGLEEDNLRELSAGSRGKRLEAAKRKEDRLSAAAAAAGNDKGQSDNDESDGDEASEEELDEDQLEAKKAAEYFEDGDDADASPGGDDASSGGVPFQQLNISRPLLRAVEAMGYVTPTSVQQRAVPFALAGRDVCASATTGSGKTAAFLLPILERLLYRPKKVAVTRVMIITPTRELGVQIHSMCRSLSQFTDIACALVVGGNKNLKAQEAELRARPDIVICTPGRMVDHLTNSASVHMDDVEILVLDEADRLLELGFQEEVAELVKSCPIGRQTLLFSATMNTKVDDLASLALNKPVRVKASPMNSAPQRLVQEFVRIRQSREQDREAILLSLLTRTFKTKTIVFFDTKILAHRLNIVLGIAGIRAAELHGNLAMTQRLEALDRFKSGDVTVLVATDLAARGLDITGVHTVINFEMPRSADSYIHRVGRTARAGCGGRSVTLIGESRRIVMKEVLKTQGEGVEIKSRAVPQSAIDHFRSKIEGMEASVKAILTEEKVEKEERCAMMEADRAVNLVEHQKEIHARPARQWIVSQQRKTELAEESKAEAVAQALKAAGKTTIPVPPRGGDADRGNTDQGAAKKEREQKLHRLTRKKRRRILAREADEREAKEEAEELKAQGKSVPSNVSSKSMVRAAKKEAREAEKKNEDKPLAQLRGAKRKLDVGSGSAFDFDLNTKKGGAAKGKDGEGKAAGAAESRYKFTEFDPNKRLKRGAKKGSAKFKSKSKFKRKK